MKNEINKWIKIQEHPVLKKEYTIKWEKEYFLMDM